MSEILKTFNNPSELVKPFKDMKSHLLEVNVEVPAGKLLSVVTSYPLSTEELVWHHLLHEFFRQESFKGYARILNYVHGRCSQAERDFGVCITLMELIQ
ncbi:hypothetical protein NC653_039242 [Populus alba x Populus x berolinensis]|uniref:Uncharacterized protein n=1 Tax=Populus alba x Populus x berolinensis TaxID=444605 RepID=A0AAD6PR36_9ROSI|nr:hypothetical protein NC653_039242 [Populus alba x Populus x berolinensis]